MRLYARTALANAFPAIHARLIDAEARFKEHAFINTLLARLREASPAPKTLFLVACLYDMKAELKADYMPLATPRKP